MWLWKWALHCIVRGVSERGWLHAKRKNKKKPQKDLRATVFGHAKSQDEKRNPRVPKKQVQQQKKQVSNENSGCVALQAHREIIPLALVLLSAGGRQENRRDIFLCGAAWVANQKDETKAVLTEETMWCTAAYCNRH